MLPGIRGYLGVCTSPECSFAETAPPRRMLLCPLCLVMVLGHYTGTRAAHRRKLQLTRFSSLYEPYGGSQLGAAAPFLSWGAHTEMHSQEELLIFMQSLRCWSCALLWDGEKHHQGPSDLASSLLSPLYPPFPQKAIRWRVMPPPGMGFPGMKFGVSHRPPGIIP